MYHTLKTNSQKTHFIHTKTNYQFNQPKKLHPNNKNTKQTRKQSKLGTDSYNRSLRRAFTRAKLLAFFNPDLNTFITLTYKTKTHTPQQVIQNIKDLTKHYNQTTKQKYSQEVPSSRDSKTPKNSIIPPSSQTEFSPVGADTKSSTAVVNSKLKKNLRDALEEKHRNEAKPFKYIYVMEYQKRGSIHVHMIANDVLPTNINKYGYKEITGWRKGYTNVQTISDYDNNFRTYLYLFKYMQKAQRIGASFIHVSRNFDKIENVDYDDYIDKLSQEGALFKEDFEFILHDKTARITKTYFNSSIYDDTTKEA